MSFFKELKHRNVFRVGVAYLVACWLMLQIVDLVLENINAPDWVMQVFMLALAVGFPIAMIVAWAFEMTPDGVKLHKNVDPATSINRHTGHQLNRGIIVILSMAIVLLLTDRYRDQLFGAAEPEKGSGSISPVVQSITETSGNEKLNLTPFPQPVDDKKSIAVLPFRDMSAARDQAYFGEGIAEELLNALVKIPGLEVASRTSAFSLAGENLDIPAIAARLGVDHILEGSIRTSGQQVRVTAQLIEVSKDVHLWSETYDGSLNDIFKIQDEITGQIAEAMKVQLGGESAVSSAELLTSNAEAYQLYLQGRHLWRQRSAASLKEAIRLFKMAVELDPGFHRAWSNMALAYVTLPTYDRTYAVEESFEQSLVAADMALSISPQSAEALLIKAGYNKSQCSISDAAHLYETAIAEDPGDPTVHHWYAILLLTTGHVGQALEHIEIAKNLDPLIAAIHASEADIYTALGDYAQAEKSKRVAASMGAWGGSLYQLGAIYLLSGETAKGKALIEKGWPDEDPEQTVARQLFLQALDDPEKQKLFEQQIGKTDGSYSFDALDNMSYLALLGSSYAFEYVSEAQCVAVVDRSVWYETFREQRKTPEFFEMMDRAGMVEYWREFGWPDDCASLDQDLAECP
jgi:TolB-like protein/Tfp pilus assembly protein PilF